MQTQQNELGTISVRGSVESSAGAGEMPPETPHNSIWRGLNASGGSLLSWLTPVVATIGDGPSHAADMTGPSSRARQIFPHGEILRRFAHPVACPSQVCTDRAKLAPTGKFSCVRLLRTGVLPVSIAPTAPTAISAAAVTTCVPAAEVFAAAPVISEARRLSVGAFWPIAPCP